MSDQSAQKALGKKQDGGEYGEFFTAVSNRRQPSVFRELHTLSLQLPQEPINLAGGMPHHSTFPVQSATFKLEDGTEISLSEDVMSLAMQYQPGMGYGPLLTTLGGIIKECHNPPHWEDRKILAVSGAQEALGMLCEAFVEKEDCVIIPEYCYATVMLALLPLQPKLIPAEVDKDGLVTDKLEDLIIKNKGSKIKMLYICPTGSNPTGDTLPLARRKHIYSLACQHDFLILEDDAYYYLNLSEEPPLPSFLSMDTQKRVIRVDTFAKTVGPGLRLGWITAPPEVLARVQRHAHAFSMHPSVLSQALVHELLATWGAKGWQEHLSNLRAFYRQQRDGMEKAASKHLQGLAEWSAPTAGMYFWMKFTGVEDTRSIALGSLLSAGVMMCPGNAFTVCPSAPSPYVRVSYSYSKPHDFDKAFQILAKVLKDHKAKGQAVTNGS